MHISEPALPLFTKLLILLVAARLLGEVFERLRQPAMIGEIIAGIVLGPAVLNLIHRTEEVRVISELGVFLLVIIAGLEINIDDILRSMRGKNIIISLSAFFVPITAGFLTAYFFGKDLRTNLFTGLCVAITALPVSIRILMDLGRIQSPLGQLIVSVAIFDDVMALTILGIILQTKGITPDVGGLVEISVLSLLKLAFFIGVISLSYGAVRRVSRRPDYLENQISKLIGFLRGREPLFALFFVFVLVFATITESLGFHFIVGAFFASLLLSEHIIGKNHMNTIQNTTQSLAMGFLAPVFFAGIGLEFQFKSLQNPAFLMAVIVVSYLSKILGGYLGGRLAGMKGPESFVLGLGLNARGIMELVIANIAYKSGMITNEVFSILVVMGVLTTLTTPLVLKRGFRYMEALSRAS
ncbi:MAG: cation:proton antiporter [Flavobacteriales bacterium]|nr:cation:proton antiporter [Flavobacteriales bacterium]MDW8409448.1 cation:proton antiporter [Flavobacteriales bacterium]